MTQARDYPDRPWVAVGVVVWREDSVLLARRANPPRRGQWSIPGGMQELGETAAQAGIREVFEETGLEITIERLLDVVDLILPDPAGRVRTHYTLIDFQGHCTGSGSTDLRAGDDAEAVLWAPYDKLHEFALWPQTQRVIDLSRNTRNNE